MYDQFFNSRVFSQSKRVALQLTQLTQLQCVNEMGSFSGNVLVRKKNWVEALYDSISEQVIDYSFHLFLKSSAFHCLGCWARQCACVDVTLRRRSSSAACTRVLPVKSPTNPPYIDPWTCSPMYWSQCCWRDVSLSGCWLKPVRAKVSEVQLCPTLPVFSLALCTWSCLPVGYKCQLSSDPLTPCSYTHGRGKCFSVFSDHWTQLMDFIMFWLLKVTWTWLHGHQDPVKMCKCSQFGWWSITLNIKIVDSDAFFNEEST